LNSKQNSLFYLKIMDYNYKSTKYTYSATLGTKYHYKKKMHFSDHPFQSLKGIKLVAKLLATKNI